MLIGWNDLLYTYKGTLFSLTKERNSDTCYDLDKSWGHQAEWNKPVIKDKYCVIWLIWGTLSHQVYRHRK